MANISKIRVGGVDYDIKDQELATEVGKKADSSALAKVATSGSYSDLSNKPTIPTAVTEATVSGWGFTKNTGTYSKPSTGIPKTDLASAVQTSLGKADTALQSYTEQYKGTVTKVKINGYEKSPDSNGLVDLGTIEGDGDSSGEVYELLDPAQSYLEIQSNHSYILLANSNQDYIINPPKGSVRLIISAEQFGSITITSSPKWANNSPIEFEDGKTFEISLLNINADDQMRALAVWTKYDTVFQVGPGMGGAE
jgi:hypothetical protein